MNTSQMPANYIKRENSEASFGRNPKTVFRHIKKAIEQGSEKHRVLLEHCCLQLLDGEIVAGTNVTSMSQIDEYRQQGRVPSWYVDADFFADYFKSLQAPASHPDQKTPKADSEGTNVRETSDSPGTVDRAIIQQYELRLAEKDDQIEELRIDKNDLRQQLKANTNLTERITGLLSHSQLAALGVPEGMQAASQPRHATTNAKVIEGKVSEDTPAESKEHSKHGDGEGEKGSQASKVPDSASSVQSPQEKLVSRQRKDPLNKKTLPKKKKTTPKKKAVTKKPSPRKKPSAKKPSFWKRDVRDLLRR